MVNVNVFALFSLASSVPDQSSKQGSRPNGVILHDTEMLVLTADNKHDSDYQHNDGYKESPEASTPSLHYDWVEFNFLKRTIVKVSELKAKEKGNTPDQVVVPENLEWGVLLTRWIHVAD